MASVNPSSTISTSRGVFFCKVFIHFMMGSPPPPPAKDNPDLVKISMSRPEQYIALGYPVMSHVNNNLPALKTRPQVQKLISENDLYDDDIRVLFMYKIEDPYPVYRWLNGWLMTSRRDADVKTKVGPLFTLLYRALEKLPRVTTSAARSVIVNNIPSLKDTFDNHEDRLSVGSKISFWGFASFSTDKTVINSPQFMGKPEQEAIRYQCGKLTGVDMEPFAPSGMGEKEILPLCPCVFEVESASVIYNKLAVSVKQLEHKDYAYVAPLK